MSGGPGDGGGGGGGGVSKLAAALIIIFVISFLALLAELFYVLWRRSIFRRHPNSIRGGADEVSQISSSESTFSSFPSSKDLLYFFCLRPTQFRLDRNSVTSNSEDNILSSDHKSDIEVIDIDLLKIQGMFGPPRFLFTIKEEEKEDLESPVEKSLRPGYEKYEKKIDDDDEGTGCRVSLEEHFKAAAVEEPVVAVAIDDLRVDDATPFSTPCASPMYFTPLASPVHVVVNGRSTLLKKS